jgi:addiction module HigA family antidote
MSADNGVPHPGARIKAEVIPSGMSVTRAAQLAGVGRPALSNLLNGNAALSADMATRLEKAFGFPRKDLLEMQAKYDAAQANKKNAPAETMAYVPPFLGIKANQIEDWVDHNIAARSRLAVFLRTLVHSTGLGLTKVEFPGNDDAEREGWDGYVEASDATPWIPAGHSGWEFGVNENIKGKADKDFKKSVKAINDAERKQTNFIFVTPRRWAGKKAWVKEKKAEGHWKDVRAYDSSDLEEWVEQSLPGQAWFANETNIPAVNVRSLDKCWTDWANVATPPLSSSLFNSAIEATKRTMLSHLSKGPNGPIVISADSTEEALAFLGQLLGERGGKELAAFRDRVLVFDKPGDLSRLAQGAQTFIPVVYTREVERELAPLAKSMHAIIIYPRNAATTEPHITLEPVNYETFNKALEEMGKDRDTANRLSTESGRSLTVLRRRLANVEAVRTPHWAVDPETAKRLVPFLFVGAWQSTNEADRLGLSLIAGERPYDELEKEFQALARLNDAPVWSVGTYRGVISKLDLLYAIAHAITSDDLKRYFSMARMVLGEDDPSLDLDEDQRWAASIHGKTREFTGAFRQGISETLVILAVNGQHLFKKRLGIDPEVEATLVVRDLLPTPLTLRILEANDRDLPTYAEAVPEEFLSIIERDLKTENPAVLGLLRPAGTGIFGHGSPSRTGILWALEGLAWNPQTLTRAALVLARMAQVEINDNWANKPTHSLESIFRSWMPQTAASHEVRVDLMKKLAERFPDVAWKICVAQFGSMHEVGNYSHKPRWRPDGYGFGEPFPTTGPIMKFQVEMVEMAINWKGHTVGMLKDLVDRLHGLSEDFQIRVWALIDTWAKSKATDAEKAELREKIRVATMSRRAALQARKKPSKAALADRAKAAYEALEPSDLLNKHAWLFRENWVEESAEEIEDIDKIDFKKRDERIQKQRIDAMREVYKAHGLSGLIELAERGKAAWWVGVHATRDLLPGNELVELMKLCIKRVLDNQDPAFPSKNIIAGGLRAVADDDAREPVLRAIAKGLSEDQVAQLLTLAYFGKQTWKLVDELGEAAQAKYWSEVTPDWSGQSEADLNESVDRLLKAERPRAAFSVVRLEPQKLDPQVLFRLLSAMATGGNDKAGTYQLEHWNVEQAFKHLDASNVLTRDQKAGLEFAYLEVLARPWDKRNDSYGIPNLERYIEAHPEVFLQAIAWAYKRKDGGTDPVEFQVPEANLKNMAMRGYKLVEAIERIPGHNHVGELKGELLAKWIGTVRQGAAELSRADIADICIGKLLSNAPVGQDGVWPCEAVRQVMEDLQSERVMEGAQTGVYNSRGVHWRGEGGDQEREIAEKYRKWGEALQFSHPFVSSKLLMELVRTYEHEASRQDTEAGIRRRLH